MASKIEINGFVKHLLCLTREQFILTTNHFSQTCVVAIVIVVLFPSVYLQLLYEISIKKIDIFFIYTHIHTFILNC